VLPFFSVMFQIAFGLTLSIGGLTCLALFAGDVSMKALCHSNLRRFGFRAAC